MNRRDVIAGLGAAAWPVVARAQQNERKRRIGVLMGRDENDPEAKARFSEFMKELAELGWTDGRNLQIDIRWAANADQAPVYAKELVALHPDVLLALEAAPTAALQQETKTIQIVFVGVSDPVGAAWVAGLPRPAGNITGLLNLDVSMGGQWLRLLLEIAPNIKRAAAMFHADAGTASYYIPSFEAAARSLEVQPITAPVHSDAELEAAITSLGREPRGGLVVMPDDGFTLVRRAQIIMLVARNNVPAVYNDSVYVRDGGLLSYGTNRADITRRSASFVDRILKGEKWHRRGREPPLMPGVGFGLAAAQSQPTNLPVRAPVNFQMALNTKTAAALGLTVPPSILLLADEVIQ
jgi:putative tryptophan/tyrosine transport system substrate-binding protein